MNYQFNIEIVNLDTGEKEDFTADNHDDATGFIANHYAKELKIMEATSQDLMDEECSEEEIINELK